MSRVAQVTKYDEFRAIRFKKSGFLYSEPSRKQSGARK